ncbi:MAG: hypothetical protein EA368_14075 [Leptolyngbya sp. DLM2.Bin27]|nr:MAG: hypothetical protein EA368_14075 [Leptolyngbya sp. DLM2.Bin27]
MLSSLLTQFRQRYPQGNLTSDLLTIHDGLYLVRVCAGAEGVTLACCLSAQATLEQAEDLATTRVLERLGLTASASADRSAPLPQAHPEASPAIAPLTLVPKPPISPPAPPAASAATTVRPTAAPPGLEYEPSFPAPEPPPLAVATPPTATVAPAPLGDRPAVPDNFDDNFDHDLINLGAGPAAAIDLSDIIAQTDVELQRLGWDVNQGREFLEKTYGKRSRHDLTDEELLEFLLYLETQSPP